MKENLMKCGHVAVAVDDKGKPVCPICVGIVKGAEEEETKLPDLTGRKAVCNQCKHRPPTKVDSKFSLAFFEYRPENETDSFYCGCWGWD